MKSDQDPQYKTSPEPDTVVANIISIYKKYKYKKLTNTDKKRIKSEQDPQY